MHEIWTTTNGLLRLMIPASVRLSRWQTVQIRLKGLTSSVAYQLEVTIPHSRGGSSMRPLPDYFDSLFDVDVVSLF